MSDNREQDLLNLLRMLTICTARLKSMLDLLTTIAVVTLAALLGLIASEWGWI